MKLNAVIALVDPRRVPFSSRLHSQRVAAILGISLGLAFFTCFFTGLVSHVMQHPPSWYAWPSRPAGFYRVTQGLHVLTGIVSIPLLLAKLWVIYPKLFEWPPAANVAQFLERVSLLPLIGGGLFQLTTGLANISQWYFFPFFFTSTHYAMAWVVIGALVVHIGAKATIVRRQLAPTSRPASSAEDASSRRVFLASVFGVGGVLALFTVGQSFSPLGKLALLSPRRPGIGPQKLPVNKTAAAAGVLETARASDYRLEVSGRVGTPLSLTLDDLRALPQHTAELPIACVEGWSAGASWSGVSIPELLRRAGAAEGSVVRLESLEKGGPYNVCVLNRHHSSDEDTLLALDLNGGALDIDHGFPARLIGPNRPGVLQTKWVHKMVVM